MIDSGNTWRSAISLQALRKLGLSRKDITPLPPGQDKVGTASKSSSLHVLGEVTHALKLSIPGHADTSYRFRPIVIDQLAMDINISGPWLKAHDWDQIHSKNALQINNKLVILYHKTNKKRKEEPFAIAYTTKSHVARRDHLTLIELKAPAVSQGRVPYGEAILTGDADFMKKTDLHPWLNAVLDTDIHGRFIAAVLNTSDNDITIPEGLKYGTITKTCTSSRQDDYPWRICNLSRSESQAQKMAQMAKDAHDKQKTEDRPGQRSQRPTRILGHLLARWLIWKNTSPEASHHYRRRAPDQMPIPADQSGSRTRSSEAA